MTATDYLRKPYARRLTPTDEGSYVATIQEFPGVVAEGKTAESSLAALEEAARAWIDAALSDGQKIPEPVELTGYSGKVALRMPRGLHKRASEMASLENVSLNQWIIGAVSYYLGNRDLAVHGLIQVSPSLRMNVIVNVTAANNLSSPHSATGGLWAFSPSVIHANTFTAPAISFGRHSLADVGG